jgi:hypothetical protein
MFFLKSDSSISFRWGSFCLMTEDQLPVRSDRPRESGRITHSCFVSIHAPKTQARQWKSSIYVGALDACLFGWFVQLSICNLDVCLLDIEKVGFESESARYGVREKCDIHTKRGKDGSRRFDMTGYVKWKDRERMSDFFSSRVGEFVCFRIWVGYRWASWIVGTVDSAF